MCTEESEGNYVRQEISALKKVAMPPMIAIKTVAIPLTIACKTAPIPWKIYSISILYPTMGDSDCFNTRYDDTHFRLSEFL